MCQSLRPCQALAEECLSALQSCYLLAEICAAVSLRLVAAQIAMAKSPDDAWAAAAHHQRVVRGLSNGASSSKVRQSQSHQITRKTVAS